MAHSKRLKHIELFAGCGGLSLGLESAGFELLFANELSPMAAETFAYNLLGEDLSGIAKNGERAGSVYWLNSKFKSEELAYRLRENPQEVPAFRKENCEVPSSLDSLSGKMIVGSIRDLNRHLENAPGLVRQLRKGDVDLVSGGPPCQSFSLAGLRQLGNDRNTLPMDFAQFVEYVRPKIALLENVTGILRPFSLPDGSKHYAWFEVAKAFASKGYVPLCLHVNAKFVGAAQNRPRFIMLAIREDIFKRFEGSVIKSSKNDFLCQVINRSWVFFKKEKSGKATAVSVDLDFYDLEKGSALFNSAIFSPLRVFSEGSWNTVENAIGDLVAVNLSEGGAFRQGEYGRMLGKEFPIKRSPRVPLNHDHRANSEHVQKRFCLYQHLGEAKSSVARDVISYIQDPDHHALHPDSFGFLFGRKFLVGLVGNKPKFKSFKRGDEAGLLKHLSLLKTKKQTQRVLVADQPAPAALSIPDDACHYAKDHFRTLTVREMARFQSFPDWFEFRSKVTTGGQMRKFEVPQYTQVGNAVPPLLGKALGKVVANILAAT